MASFRAVMYSDLTVTGFNKLGNCPFVVLGTSSFGRGGFDRHMPLAEIIVSEAQRNSSLKDFHFLPKAIGQAAKASAVHKKRVVSSGQRNRVEAPLKIGVGPHPIPHATIFDCNVLLWDYTWASGQNGF